MALALATAFRLKPEIRLAQAVSEYEADLTMEQKHRFNSYKTQVHKCPPQIHDVMRLTAEIDQKVSPNVGRGRCYGPRFTNFLQAIQQFVGLGDIIVGGSQNLIACGVWSVARMSLLVSDATRDPSDFRHQPSLYQSIGYSATYLEKVSRLFMTIGRSAPRYQSMAAIYPRSKELQSNLCEYFIVVVRLCHKILRFTQKSAVMQFTTALNSSALDSDQSELEIWATAIKEEVDLLMAVRSEDEANKNAVFRNWSFASKSLESHQRQFAATRRILDSCSRYDYQANWKKTRKIGNATIFKSDAKYQNWKSCQDSSTLMYTGRLGSGKSVLMANIVDDLNLDAQSNSTVAYFFCRHDESESLKAKTVIGSLARQLLLGINVSALDLKEYDPNDLKLIDNVIKLVRTALPRNHRAIFVLDGLDECGDSVTKELIGHLEEMQATFTLLLCVSLRLEPNKLVRYPPEQFVDCSLTSIPVANPDIDIFIERELENRIQENKLRIGAPELILDIRDALLAGSQGMFLWVALQIDILCAMKTDESIREALSNLPKDLSDTFSHILKKHKPRTKPDQRSIFEIIMVAQRPLTSGELQEVLSVTPGDSNWNPGKLINDVDSVLACCGSLVTIDEEDTTVQLIHHSVKQFLIENYCDSSGTKLDMDVANLKMAKSILTYLSYDQFDRQLSASVVPRMNVGSAPYHIIKSTIRSHSSVQEIALKLLKVKRTGDQDIGKTLQATTTQRQRPDEYAFHFLDYAKLYWLHHLCATSAIEIPELSLLEKIFDRNTISNDDGLLYCDTPLGRQETDIQSQKSEEVILFNGRVHKISHTKSLRGHALLFWACNRADSYLLWTLLQISHVDPDQRNEQGQTPLLCAAMYGYRDVVRDLFYSGRVDPGSRDSSGCTPLIWAARGGFTQIVRDLVTTKEQWLTGVLRRSSIKSPSAVWAQLAGERPLEKLLSSKERVDINCVDKYGRTALSYAAQLGSSECLRELLELGADFTLADDTKRTPLIYAAMSRSANTVQQFYSHPGLEVDRDYTDSKDVRGRTALSYAAGYGTLATVHVFLADKRIDPDSMDNKNRSPLSYAARYGTLDIVNALLSDNRVDPDSRCVRGLSPLSRAVERETRSVKQDGIMSKEQNTTLTIVQAFLHSGRVDINARDNWGWTALTRAVTRESVFIVAALLSHGCDAQIRDLKGRTALDYALDSENKDIIHLLRAHIPGTAGKRIYTSFGHIGHRLND